VTIFGIFLTPVFYVVIRWLVEKNAPAVAVAHAPSSDGVSEAEQKRVEVPTGTH
jgi:hypothetical protein